MKEGGEKSPKKIPQDNAKPKQGRTFLFRPGMRDEQQSLLPGALGGSGLNVNYVNAIERSGPRSNFPNSTESIKTAVFMWTHCFLKLFSIQLVFCALE